MNGRLSITRMLRVLGCAAAVSAISSSSFALSVTSPAELADTKSTKLSALDTGTSALTTSTSNQAVVSTSVQQNPSLVTTPSQTTVIQPTTSAPTASTIATSPPTTSTLANINPTYPTLSLAPGLYNVTSPMLDHGTLSLTAAGNFTLSIATYSTVNPSKVILSAGMTWANVLFSYSSAGDIVVSGTINQGGSVLQGILLALNANVSAPPPLTVGDFVPPPPPISDPPRAIATVSDSGSTGILSCLSCLALALLRFGVFPVRLIGAFRADTITFAGNGCEPTP